MSCEISNRPPCERMFAPQKASKLLHLDAKRREREVVALLNLVLDYSRP